MRLETFKKKLKETPRAIGFAETMEVIDQNIRNFMKAGFGRIVFEEGPLTKKQVVFFNGIHLIYGIITLK